MKDYNYVNESGSVPTLGMHTNGTESDSLGAISQRILESHLRLISLEAKCATQVVFYLLLTIITAGLILTGAVVLAFAGISAFAMETIPSLTPYKLLLAWSAVCLLIGTTLLLVIRHWINSKASFFQHSRRTIQEGLRWLTKNPVQ